METQDVILLLIIAGILIYFLPSIVASYKDHKNVRNIFILNLFLGWSVIAWVIALIWANNELTINKCQIKKS